MIKKIFKIAIVCFCYGWITIAFSSTLPLTNDLIALSSSQGNTILKRSYEPDYFWPLMLHFVAQQNLTYCSIASSVMVLNALDVQGPDDPIIKPYHYFTQDNFFTSKVQRFLTARKVQIGGATLDQLAHALAQLPVQVTAIHADEMSAKEFRSRAKNIISQHKGYMVVNFSRKALKQTGSGHVSPIGAYDEMSDRFLILDVSRYRYPPFWVKTNDLWEAMHTLDKSVNKYRGLIIISAK